MDNAKGIEAAAKALHAQTLRAEGDAFMVVGDSVKAAQVAVQTYLAAMEAEGWVFVNRKPLCTKETLQAALSKAGYFKGAED